MWWYCGEFPMSTLKSARRKSSFQNCEQVFMKLIWYDFSNLSNCLFFASIFFFGLHLYNVNISLHQPHRAPLSLCKRWRCSYRVFVWGWVPRQFKLLAACFHCILIRRQAFHSNPLCFCVMRAPMKQLKSVTNTPLQRNKKARPERETGQLSPRGT